MFGEKLTKYVRLGVKITYQPSNSDLKPPTYQKLRINIMDNSKNRTTPEKYLHELYEVEVHLLTLGKIIVIYNLYNATTPFWHNNKNVVNP